MIDFEKVINNLKSVDSDSRETVINIVGKTAKIGTSDFHELNKLKKRLALAEEVGVCSDIKINKDWFECKIPARLIRIGVSKKKIEDAGEVLEYLEDTVEDEEEEI